MLDGYVSNVSSNVRTKMLESKIRFFLTGPRYFELTPLNHSWDFFIQNGPEIPALLDSMGFILLADTYTYDNILYSKYKHGKEPITIEVVKNARQRQDLQERIRKYYLTIWNSLNRQQQEFVNEIVYSMTTVSKVERPQEQDLPNLEKRLSNFLK